MLILEVCHEQGASPSPRVLDSFSGIGDETSADANEPCLRAKFYSGSAVGKTGEREGAEGDYHSIVIN